MKRSVGTFRKILLQIEARPNGEMDDSHAIEGISEADLHGHVELLVEGGYLKAINETAFGMQYPMYMIERLTFEGHEFAMRLIRFRGHLPKGGYDVPNGNKQVWPTHPAAVL